MLGNQHAMIRTALNAYRTRQTEQVLKHPDPRDAT
jgi:hypothetical protein